MEEEELCGYDYVDIPVSQLAKHPDFSPEALSLVTKVLGMTSAQLETTSMLIKETSNG